MDGKDNDFRVHPADCSRVREQKKASWSGREANG